MGHRPRRASRSSPHHQIVGVGAVPGQRDGVHVVAEVAVSRSASGCIGGAGAAQAVDQQR